MKRLAYTLLIAACLFPFTVAAQGISQLQQFTSTTSPSSAITQTVFGKALRLTGLNGSGATRCVNVSALGVFGIASADCGTGGGSSFAYPFPTNATSTSIAFNGGLTGVLTGSLVGNASTATALAANGTNCSAGNAPLGIDASGNVESCFDVWTEAENTSAAYISSIVVNSPLSGSGTSASHLTIANAAADGSTKGAASFTTNDFDASSGNIALDYANGQKASGSQPGFLSSADYSTFNGKESILTFSWPLIRSTNAISYGGLSTSSAAVVGNIPYFSGVNTFANVATGTLAANAPLSVTAGRSVIGGSATLTLDTSGTWSGNAATASALASNGANCSAGMAPLGVNAAGAVESCFDVWTEAENTAAAYAAQATTLTVAGTANQITSSAGAQSLAANRTWTLSFPSLVVFPGTASSTALSALDYLYVGRNATTTIRADGVASILPYASSTALTVSGRLYATDIRDASNNSLSWASNELSANGGKLGDTMFTWLNAYFTYASTSQLSVSNALYIPASSSQTPSVLGQCALDTTSDQLKCFGTAARVYPSFQSASFTYATSTAWTGTTTLPLGPATAGETWASVACFTDAGTAGVSFYDGTNRMNYIPTASTTVNTIALSTNNSFTANEKRYVDIGNPASSPTKVSCTIKKSFDPD
jgi:hypothetical protein